MQKTSLILTFLVSFLMVHPFVKCVYQFSGKTTRTICSNNCCFIEKNVCRKFDQPIRSKKPCCPNGLCNPFSTFCFIVLSEKNLFVQPILDESKTSFQHLDEFTKSEYLFSIFQPPEFKNKIA